MCMYVHICMRAHARVCIWRSDGSVRCCSLIPFTLVVLRQGLLLAWDLSGCLGSLASNPQRPTCFCHPCSGITCVYLWIWGLELRFSWLHGKPFSHRTISSVPSKTEILEKSWANIWNWDYSVYLFHVFRNSWQLNSNDFLCLPDGKTSEYSQGQRYSAVLWDSQILRWNTATAQLSGTDWRDHGKRPNNGMHG